MQRYLLPRLADFFFIMMFAGALILGPRMLNGDSDLGRHLTLGNYILRSGTVPTHDILSFTKAGDSRPPYEWLAQVAFAAAYRLLSLDGVALLTSLVIASAFTAVYLDGLHRSQAPILAMGMATWAALASSLHWLSRPHVFSFLLFALWLAVLDRLRRAEHQPLWHLPVLMLIWANTHGGFVFGFLAYAAHLAGWLLEFWRRSSDWPTGRRLLLAGAASLLASVLTPDLWGNWVATLNNRSAYVLGRTVETMPLNIRLPNVWPFVAMAVLVILLIVLRRGRIPTAHYLLLSGLAVMAVAMTRNVSFFVIAAAPLCAEWLSAFIGRSVLWERLEQAAGELGPGSRPAFWSTVAVCTAVLAFAAHYAFARDTLMHWNSDLFPTRAVEWLEQNPQQGRMFNDFNWGGYLLYKRWPEQLVFIDSQSDFYGEPFIRQYEVVLAGSEGWQAALDKYDVAWILIPRSAPLATAASQSPEWRLAYQDSLAAIFIRR